MIVFNDIQFIKDVKLGLIDKNCIFGRVVMRSCIRGGLAIGMSKSNIYKTIRNFNKFGDKEIFDAYYDRYCEDAPVLPVELKFRLDELNYARWFNNGGEGRFRYHCWYVQEKRIYLTLLILFNHLRTKRLAVPFSELTAIAEIPNAYRNRMRIGDIRTAPNMGVIRDKVRPMKKPAFYYKCLVNNSSGEATFTYEGDSFYLNGHSFKSNIKEFTDMYL